MGRMYRIACVRKMRALNYVNERWPAVVDETWHGVRDVTVNVRGSLRCMRIGQTIYALKNSYLNISRRLHRGVRMQLACAIIALMLTLPPEICIKNEKQFYCKYAKKYLGIF